MDWYKLLIVLHLLAAMLWLGHMVFWSVILGPITKRIEPEETKAAVRHAISRHGGLGWPALSVFLMSGLGMLSFRGLLTPEGLELLLAEAGGHVFLCKLALVLGMVVFQARIGHRPAPKLIYVNMLAAFVIVALSVLLVRDPSLALPSLAH